jgi:hypothetical protein
MRRESLQMKSMIAVLFVLLLACSPRKTKQGWIMAYGGDYGSEGFSVQQTSDGGYIVAGYNAPGLSSFDRNDIYVIKTNASGDTIWSKTYGGTENDEGNSVRQTADGGYIIAGYTRSFGAGSYDVYVIKTNASGDTLWTRTYGGTGDDYGRSVQQTADGGYIVAGQTNSFGAGGFDVCVIKTDASGDTLWTRTYGGTGDDHGYSVQQTSDGGYIVAGYTTSFGAGSADVYLIKTDASGDTLWTRTYGGTSDDCGYSVRQTSDKGYVIAGTTFSFGAGDHDVYLMRTNASGDTLWTKTYGRVFNDEAYSVQQTTDGGYVVAGWTDGDVWLIKTDASGDSLWTRGYGATEPDYGYSVQQTSDGGYIIAGCANLLYLTHSSVYLIKTDANGDVGEE